MWPAIFFLIKDALLPEIAKWMRERAAANGGKLPTDAELIAHFETDWKRSVAAGQAFLDATLPPAA